MRAMAAASSTTASRICMPPSCRAVYTRPDHARARCPKPPRQAARKSQCSYCQLQEVRRMYYGWLVVATLAVTETISWGVLYYAFAVLLQPMRRELGWSLGQMTTAFSLALLLNGLAAILVGRWLDRHGPRLLMTAGSCAGVALVLAWSQVTDLRHFFLIWGAIGVVMATVL